MEAEHWNAWEEYFQPVSGHAYAEDFNNTQLGANIRYFSGKGDFPDLDELHADLVILGAGYDSSDLSAPLNDTPNHIRYWLYKLCRGNYQVRILDLGNFGLRTSLEENCNVLSKVLQGILERNMIPVVLGGGHEMAYALYLAYARSGRFCNVCDVNATLDFQEITQELRPGNMLGRILGEKDSFLFHYANLAYQSYFSPPDLVRLFKEFHFDLIRLGEVRRQMEDAEPVIRDAHAFTINMGAVKYADAPHALHATPNGLQSDEICRLARYAGLSQKLSSFGLFGIRPGGDVSWTDHHLAAQVIWHLIEGFYNRKEENLDVRHANYLEFTVALTGFPDQIVFYKNKISEKWWMAVPIQGKASDKYGQQEYLVPCALSDYEFAASGEIPERWIRRFHQLND
jgi:formiminoglutamase